jgi:hypothetical protein
VVPDDDDDRPIAQSTFRRSSSQRSELDECKLGVIDGTQTIRVSGAGRQEAREVLRRRQQDGIVHVEVVDPGEERPALPPVEPGQGAVRRQIGAPLPARLDHTAR